MKEIIIKGVNEKILFARCKNGLQVYMMPNNQVNNFFITFTARYGALHTEFKFKGEKTFRQVPNGIAHFLEHVNFNEGENSSATKYFEQLGSSINAYTSFSDTTYEVLSSTFFQENLEHLLDYVTIPYFTKKNVAKEQNIVVEEIKMNKNKPGSLLYFGSNQGIFHYDKHRNRITGEISDIRKITAAKLKLIHDNFYHPKNMFVIITGNFKPLEAMAIIRNNQNKKTFPPYRYPIIKRVTEPSTVARKYREIRTNVEMPTVKISFKIKRKKFDEYPDGYLGVMISYILRSNFGPSSELKEKLSEEGKITSMSYSSASYNSSPFIIISIAVDTYFPNEIVKIIKEKMNNLTFDEEMLLRRRRANIASLVRSYDNIENINYDIQGDLITYGHVVDDYFDIYTNIKMTEIESVIKLINTDQESVTVLLPHKKTIS